MIFFQDQLSFQTTSYLYTTETDWLKHGYFGLNSLYFIVPNVDSNFKWSKLAPSSSYRNVVFYFSFNDIVIITSEKKKTFTCHFDDDFLCGYINPFAESLSWQRKNAREIYAENKPKGDPYEQDGMSSLRFCLLYCYVSYSMYM